MRVRGDTEACLCTAERLRRASEAVRCGADGLRAVRSSVPSWTGDAADGWAATVLAHSDAGRDLADLVGALADTLARHAEGLAGLKQQGRALRERADAAGLFMDGDGWVAPLPLPRAAPASPLQELFRTWPLLSPEHVREELLRAVAWLRRAEQDLHDELVRQLRRLDVRAAVPPPGTPSLPTWWDLPPTVADAGSRVLSHGSAAGVSATGRALSRALPGAGLVYGIAVDVGAHDRPVGEAVLRNGVAAGASAGAVVAAGALAPAAIAAAPVLLPVAIAVGVGLAAAALVDAATHRGPPPEDLDRFRPRPRPAPGPPPVPPGTRSAPPVSATTACKAPFPVEAAPSPSRSPSYGEPTTTTREAP